MEILFKVNQFLLSDKYRFVDMFLGFAMVMYALYKYITLNEISLFWLISGIVVFVLGLTDLTRKGLKSFFKSFIKEV